ncbi:MAG: cyclic nucleotide-binding domain-containing protein, partial [Synergistales bacterium]|nr:cyclic nucleotide-binding domain-containing protein [Synergistales bacterium]
MGKKILATLPGFDGLNEEDLEKILAIAVAKKYEKKELLFSDGERGAGFFVIVRGRVKVIKVSPEGKEVILHLCGP